MAGEAERAESARGHSPATRVVHAGLPEAETGQPFLPGPVFAAPFHLPGDDPHAAPFGYARDGHPTLALYEQAVAELDNATAATVFGSGMAACSAVLLTCLRPGDLLVASADGYNAVRTLANGYLADRGVQVRYCQTDGDWDVDGARLVWVESPSNPELRVTDIAALAQRAHDAGALVAADNTLLTPLGQQPLELGADFAVYSDTKAMTGHSDVLMGHVATRDEELGRQIRSWRTTTGSLPGPFEAWLAHRSLATLDVRLERQLHNGQAIAHLLNNRGIEARSAGMVVAFTLDNAQRFLEECELVIEATSFGGIHTSAERRARWGQGDDVPEGFIRLSAGIEATDDLLADIQSALDSSAKT
jgi:cystathionine gamma-lyase